MTKEEFQEFYKKNKVLVIGAPIILGILLLDTFILKPARRKAKEGNTPAAIAQPADAGQAAAAPGVDLLAPPAPLVLPTIPPLSPAVEKRFMAAESYPYPATKNIFLPEIKATVMTEALVAAPTTATTTDAEEVPVYIRPEISYNGFFVMGPDLVAILKLNGKLMLLRAQQRLPHTPFLLQSIHPDRVEIADTEAFDHVFDVPLTESEIQPLTTAAGLAQTAKAP